ncbi:MULTISPECIES: hypothetical protein [unclassified Arthrobacter]|uniref:hypothetical protein n=1 Tax=unclassified Arthrobacter TaxID=235627 RepID=UPI001F465B42|nr:hypothetical protein [Arthrobacter sp. FW305-BF8]UKA53946.1 hypothetical protein LFT45_19925 [Arthrobacter sp. FW305-BF8]
MNLYQGVVALGFEKRQTIAASYSPPDSHLKGGFGKERALLWVANDAAGRWTLGKMPPEETPKRQTRRSDLHAQSARNPVQPLNVLEKVIGPEGKARLTLAVPGSPDLAHFTQPHLHEDPRHQVQG